ncbi:MAG: NERD domain-containing protein [Acetatifactor sp.]|nr:NERD domain-containing protein [Acetatifactor sp.]
MGIFDKLKDPVFIKPDSEAEKQLAALQALKRSASATGKNVDKFDQEISKVEAGILGEKQVRFELENSHMPMYVIHDLFLEDNGLTAQIDYMVFTRKNTYVIECKNLYGNIEINNKGDFIRTFNFGKRFIKEGIYSPITQNQRHLDLIKQIRLQSKTNIITKAMFEKYFDTNFHSIVVLANPKTVLNDKFAKKEIKQQVIRADQLIAYIKNLDSQKNDYSYSDKEMEDLANFFLNNHKQNPVDYIKKFSDLVDSSVEETEKSSSGATIEKTADKDSPKICPLCGAPMILRTAQKGNNKGGSFYGCSTYPKCKGIRQVD